MRKKHVCGMSLHAIWSVHSKMARHIPRTVLVRSARQMRLERDLWENMDILRRALGLDIGTLLLHMVLLICS
jgi:hypothetical protein